MITELNLLVTINYNGDEEVINADNVDSIMSSKNKSKRGLFLTKFVHAYLNYLVLKNILVQTDLSGD